MPITINGSGTVTGISVGGLPDGCVDTDTLAANAVNESKIADFLSSGAINSGGIRIQTGTTTSDSSTSSSSTDYGVSTQKYRSHTITGLSGFASAQKVWASLASDYHEAQVSGIHSVSTSQFTVVIACSRDAGITSKAINWLAIGEAS